MRETTNYKLKKPEYNEYADIMDINNNMDVVDQILKGLDERLKKVLTKEQTDSFYAKIAHRHNVSDIDNLTPTIRTTKVNNSIQADNSDKLKNMNFNWAGQAGQPPWLWGGADGTNMYVYNPANFSVANSNSVQGFQFRNNNGILEVLINGVWMSVGGQIYNRQQFKKFQSWLSETNYMQGHEDQIITIFDIQKPCKIVDFAFYNFVWTYGNTTDTTIPKLYVKEYRIYIDDILAKHIRVNASMSTDLTEGTETYTSNSGQVFKILIGELQANRRLRIDVTVGVNPSMYFTGWINILYHN